MMISVYHLQTCQETGFPLCVRVNFLLYHLVNTLGIFMRKNDVQMEMRPADANLDGLRSP